MRAKHFVGTVAGLALATVFGAATFTASAQSTDAGSDIKPISSRVTEATVFLQGAELTQTATATLARGANEISIEGLSPAIDRNSLKVSFDRGVVVSAFEYSIDYLSSARTSSARLDMLKDSIDIYQAHIAATDVDIQVNSAMQGYLETGIAKNVSGSEAGLGIDELRKTMDYYKSKSEEILNGARELRLRRSKLYTDLGRVQNQYNEEAGLSNRNSGVLKLSVTAPVAGTYPVTITYFTPSAGWQPFYDINVASTDEPIRIAGRSRVSQTTGIDWENVRLTLSTAMPSGGKIAPLFSTWFLREYVRPMPVYMNAATVRNEYSYDAFEEVAVADALQGRAAGIMARGASSVAKQTEPVYVIDGRVVDISEYEAIDPSMIESVNVLKDNSATSIYGSRASGGAVVVTLKNSVEDFIATADNALSVTYAIDLPYSIPGNGKEQNIDLTTREAEAEYKFYSAPKLDPATYLIAEIPNWQQLGLLSAPANITYDGTYLGETWIDASATNEKLTLTLGTDKRVSVTRELARDHSATRAIGSGTEQTFTYTLKVHNGQTVPVYMILKDQYPTSTDRNIVVTLDERATTPWSENKTETGVVTWERELAPGETRTYTLSYTVRYPKNMNLNL